MEECCSKSASGSQASALRIVVLSGGVSSEREISLVSGKTVCTALASKGHIVENVDPEATEIAAVDWTAVDVCFIALHGGAGEDGRLQEQLEKLHIPYTGSGPGASRIGMSKSSTKRRLLECGITAPRGIVLNPTESPGEIDARASVLGYPMVIKPDCGGSSIGLSLVRTRGQLAAAMERSRSFGGSVVAEQFINGTEFSITVIERDVLAIAQINAVSELFDFKTKYQDGSVQISFISPCADEDAQRIGSVSRRVAEAVGTVGLIRVDLIRDEAGQPWVLEVNTIPGMAPESLAPCAAAFRGIDMAALCDLLARSAIARFVHRGFRT